MEGIIVYNHYNILGSITTNTETGIYGKLDRIERIFDSKEAYPAVAKEEIQVGKAYIRCAVSGKTEDYTVRITKVDLDAREVNKGIEIQVTDKRLLKLTGGIVQGMSGSPIMQNGKIIGAVTHVFRTGCDKRIRNIYRKHAGKSEKRLKYANLVRFLRHHLLVFAEYRRL